jgi:hypothetical protein
VVHCLGSCVDEEGEVSCVLFLNINLLVCIECLCWTLRKSQDNVFFSCVVRS